MLRKYVVSMSSDAHCFPEHLLLPHGGQVTQPDCQDLGAERHWALQTGLYGRASLGQFHSPVIWAATSDLEGIVAM